MNFAVKIEDFNGNMLATIDPSRTGMTPICQFHNALAQWKEIVLVAPNGCRFSGPYEEDNTISLDNISALSSWWENNL